MNEPPLMAATTTVTFNEPNPTALGAPASTVQSGDAVPIGPIVGGTCAGVVLAVLAVCGWKSWGRSIRRQHRRNIEKSRARAAARAYRRSVTQPHPAPVLLGNARPLLTATASSAPPPPPSAAAVDRNVKFAILPRTPTDTVIYPSPAAAAATTISAPKPLKSKSPDAEPRPPTRSSSAFPRPPDRRLYTPVQPSPLAVPDASRNPTQGLLSSKSGSITHTSSTSEKLPAPRYRPSLASLRRHSKASQHSGSDQSTAESVATHWSWRALLTGPGFSLAQLGIGSGRNRLSADTSTLASWPEHPGEPIGYAFSTVSDDDFEHDDLRPVGHDTGASEKKNHRPNEDAGQFQ